MVMNLQELPIAAMWMAELTLGEVTSFGFVIIDVQGG